MSNDDWDPNVVFAPTDHEHCIYGDDRASIWAVVDEIDYQWAIQWKWSPMWSRGGKKVYLRRNLQILHQPQFQCEHEGLVRIRTQRSLFLHTAIMERARIEPPSEHHKIIDHRDGDELNCRRDNLRWATYSLNSKNINGSHANELWDGT